MFFQHENRFRYKFFRYCSIFKVLCAAVLAADDLIILPQKRFFVKHFFEKLLNFSELKSFSSFSVLTGTFERSLVLFKGFLLRLQKSFFCLSAWRSHIVPYRNYFCKPFLHFFALCIHHPVFRSVSGVVLSFLPPFLRKNSRCTKSAAAVALGFSSFLPASSPAGSARQPLPASAARRSGQWAWDPVHYNKHPPG